MAKDTPFSTGGGGDPPSPSDGPRRETEMEGGGLSSERIFIKEISLKMNRHKKSKIEIHLQFYMRNPFKNESDKNSPLRSILYEKSL